MGLVETKLAIIPGAGESPLGGNYIHSQSQSVLRRETSRLGQPLSTFFYNIPVCDHYLSANV